MTRRKWLLLILIMGLLFAFLPTGSVFAQGTDVIKEYTIDIVPQDDGTLITNYSITWCVISDAAGPLTWFTIGMPNETFDIIDYSGDVTSVRPESSGFDYLLRFDLSRAANTGDCVDASASVKQYGMAYQYEETEEVFFQFIPGWFDEIPVEHLKVSWALPADSAHLKSIDPQPQTRTETTATWETALDEGDKFTVSLFYDQAAFPGYNPESPAAPEAGNSGADPSNPGQTGPDASSSDNTPSAPGFFESISISICGCLIVLLVIIVLIIIFSAMANSARNYRGGSTFGGYRGGGWSGGKTGGGSIFGSGGGSVGRSSRSGGGSGLFGGRGSSCACVSSGCACACAGGGRAGCSRKGFDVSGLFKPRNRGEE